MHNRISLKAVQAFEAAARLSPMQMSFLSESRRLDNRRLKRELVLLQQQADEAVRLRDENERLRAVLAPLQVECVLPPEPPLLYVHAALIEQALINVLENAARFSPPGGRLRVALEYDEQALRFVGQGWCDAFAQHLHRHIGPLPGQARGERATVIQPGV